MGRGERRRKGERREERRGGGGGGGRDDEEKIQAVWLGINCAKMKKALASWIRERERETSIGSERGGG